MSTVPERYLIDSMIHDRIADDPLALRLVKDLVEAAAIVLLTTHVQEDEITRIPNAARVKQLLQVPVKRVPTLGLVLDYSRIDAARLSEAEPFESLRRGNLNHTEDALIAATAQYESATLVTEDQTLTRRAKAQGISVVSWDAFLERLERHERSAPGKLRRDRGGE